MNDLHNNTFWYSGWSWQGCCICMTTLCSGTQWAVFLQCTAQCHTRSEAHGSQQHTIMQHRWALTLHHAERPHSFTIPSLFRPFERALFIAWSQCSWVTAGVIEEDLSICLYCPRSSVSLNGHTHLHTQCTVYTIHTILKLSSIWNTIYEGNTPNNSQNMTRQQIDLKNHFWSTSNFVLNIIFNNIL